MGLFKRKLLIIKHIYANNILKNIFYSNMLNLVSDFDFFHTSVHYLLPCLFSIPDIQKKYLARLFWFPTRYSWRRERDSNPWTANAVNGFRDRPVRPLRHLSLKTILSQRGDFHPFAFAKIQLIFQLLKFISIFYPSSSISYCFSD